MKSQFLKTDFFIRFHNKYSKHVVLLISSSVREVMIENIKISILRLIYFSLTWYSIKKKNA